MLIIRFGIIQWMVMHQVCVNTVLFIQSANDLISIIRRNECVFGGDFLFTICSFFHLMDYLH